MYLMQIPSNGIPAIGIEDRRRKTRPARLGHFIVRLGLPRSSPVSWHNLHRDQREHPAKRSHTTKWSPARSGPVRQDKLSQKLTL